MGCPHEVPRVATLLHWNEIYGTNSPLGFRVSGLAYNIHTTLYRVTSLIRKC